MPAAPYTDMHSFLGYVRQLPDVRLSDDEATELLTAGGREIVFESLMKIVPYVTQRYIGDAHLRENYQDIIQEGNLAVWRCIDSWVPGKGMSLDSWAFMYARKAVIAEVRRDLKYLQQHEELDLEEDVDSLVHDNEHTDENAWSDAMEALATYRALRKRLGTQRDRHVLTMLRDGFTQKDIAYRLGLSQSRVSRIIRRITDYLRVLGA
jgi:RNA polymerase sigma factor (sigma-70 family)